MYPELSVKGTLALPNNLLSFIDGSSKCLVPTSQVNHCVSLYHSYGAGIDVYPWYQRRKVSFSWRGVSVGI